MLDDAVDRTLRSGLFRRDILANEEYFLPRETLNILFVVDGDIRYNTDFGLPKVLDTLRESPPEHYYYVDFVVTGAHRDGAQVVNPTPGDHEPKYTGFRFTMDGFDINDYQQIWFFGWRPGNFSNDTSTLMLEDGELALLTKWMDDKKGGVFATGDHDDLGATLCRRIPRVGTMRKWSQDDPPFTGANRHNTNFPANANQLAGIEILPERNEKDGVPARITLKPYLFRSWTHPFVEVSPHPVLSGLDGPIDILPDHQHEGEVIDEREVVLTGTYNFDGKGDKPEYPTVDGVQATPEVIASGKVLGAPIRYEFGDAKTKQFGVVGVYDGHKVGVGRVVVDSTWHHWMDMNLDGLATSNPTDYARVQNYFRNVALWLATPDQRASMFMRATWGSIWVYPGVEEYMIRKPVRQLGETAVNVLGRRVGRDLTRSWLIELLSPTTLEELLVPETTSQTVPPMAQPPIEFFESHLLGGALKELLQIAGQLRSLDGEESAAASEPRIAEAMLAGFRKGQNELLALYGDFLTQGEKVLTSIKNTVRPNLTEKNFISGE